MTKRWWETDWTEELVVIGLVIIALYSGYLQLKEAVTFIAGGLVGYLKRERKG